MLNCSAGIVVYAEEKKPIGKSQIIQTLLQSITPPMLYSPNSAMPEPWKDKIQMYGAAQLHVTQYLGLFHAALLTAIRCRLFPAFDLRLRFKGVTICTGCESTHSRYSTTPWSWPNAAFFANTCLNFGSFTLSSVHLILRLTFFFGGLWSGIALIQRCSTIHFRSMSRFISSCQNLSLERGNAERCSLSKPCWVTSRKKMFCPVSFGIVFCTVRGPPSASHWFRSQHLFLWNCDLNLWKERSEKFHNDFDRHGV